MAIKGIKNGNRRKAKRDKFGRYSSTAQSVASRRFNRALMSKMPAMKPRLRSRGDLYADNGSLKSARRRQVARRTRSRRQ